MVINRVRVWEAARPHILTQIFLGVPAGYLTNYVTKSSVFHLSNSEIYGKKTTQRNLVIRYRRYFASPPDLSTLSSSRGFTIPLIKLYLGDVLVAVVVVACVSFLALNSNQDLNSVFQR